MDDNSARGAENRADGSDRRPLLRVWRGGLARALLSAAAGSLVLNVLSNDYRWRVVTVVIGMGAIFAVAAWLHQLPVGAPLTYQGRTALLTIALVSCGWRRPDRRPACRGPAGPRPR